MKAKDLIKVLSQHDENIDVSICIEDGYGDEQTQDIRKFKGISVGLGESGEGEFIYLRCDLYD